MTDSSEVCGIDRHVGARIRTTREAASISVEELAKAVGASPEELVEIEAGRVRASAVQMIAAARRLDVDAGYFLRDPLRPPAPTIVDDVRDLPVFRYDELT